MYGIRAPAVISAGIFALIILAVIVGNGLISAGIVKNPSAFQTPAKIVFFTLFVAFGFSLVPVMVKLVLSVQVLVGNANVGFIRAAIDHAAWIVAVLWILMALGLATALPAAIRQGFFR